MSKIANVRLGKGMPPPPWHLATRQGKVGVGGGVILCTYSHTLILLSTLHSIHQPITCQTFTCWISEVSWDNQTKTALVLNMLKCWGGVWGLRHSLSAEIETRLWKVLSSGQLEFLKLSILQNIKIGYDWTSVGRYLGAEVQFKWFNFFGTSLVGWDGIFAFDNSPLGLTTW